MPQHVEFRLPDVGEGLTEADIVGWLVQVGDTVTVNQNLLEIETAKSLVELPSPHAGVVTELLVRSGDTVEVGTPIIRIDTDPNGAPAPDAGAGQAASSAQHSTEAAAESAAEGTDAEEPDDAEGSGSVLVGYGTQQSSARRRRRRSSSSASGPAQPSPGDQAASVPPARGQTASTPEAADAGVETPFHVLAKPPVRKLAKELGLDLTRVPGTGPGGIVTRADVISAAENSEPERLVKKQDDDRPWLDGGTVSADGRQTRVPVRSVRARTAEAMVASAFTAPHVTVFVTVDVTKSMRLVQRLKQDRDFADVKVTPLLIAAKALILAIRRYPMVSASWDEKTQEIVYKHYINLGIAASTSRGLLVPNIKDAHRLSMHDLATEIGELTATARQGKTTPRQMSDGTVTITNVGVFGIDTGTPILNPGESAILAFGSITERPWVHKGKVKPRWVTQLALSVDHRLVDGELASRALHDVATIMEHPEQGLVWG